METARIAQRRLRACSLVAALCAALGLAAQDVKVNADPPGTVQNEPALAYDWGQPNILVVAYNDRVGTGQPSPLGVSASADGGITWLGTQLAVPPDPFQPGGFLDNVFDPFLAFGPPNNMFAGYVATTQFGGGTSGLFIERSEDGGLTWSGPTTISLDPPLVIPPNFRFNDRPHIATHPAGFVNVAWIKDVGFGQPTSDIYYAFSNPPPGPGGGPFPPTGLSFTTPVTVNDNPNGIDMANAPHVATHPSGQVYVAWIDYDVTVANSATGRLLIDTTLTPTLNPVFGPDQLIRQIDPQPRFLSSASGSGDDARAGSYPFVAVDPNDGTGMTVFVVYAEEVSPQDEGDVFLQRSSNGGATWSAPVRVNDDSTIRDQMHPQMAVAPDSSIVVAWYDKRNSANDDSWDVYAARSADGGASFLPNVRISDVTAATPTSAGAPGTPWLGEYLGLVIDGTDALVAFTSSTSDGRGDVWFDRLALCSFPSGTTYCTAKVNSLGCVPAIGSNGCFASASVTLPYLITAANVVNNKNGILFYGQGPASNPFQGGLLCVQPPVQRTPLQWSAGNPPPDDCSGTYAFDLNGWIQSGVDPALAPGVTVHCQYWSRDPGHPVNGSGLTDAIRVVVQP